MITLALTVGLVAAFDVQPALALDAADLCRTKPRFCTPGNLDSDATFAASGRTTTVPEVAATIRSYFFATNREFDPTELKKTVRDYGKLYLTERRAKSTEDQVRYGELRISMPPSRGIGTMPVPPRDSPRYVQTHIVVVKHDEMTVPKFLRALSLAAASSVNAETNGRFFLYVHGVNNTFGGAARRVAQVTRDIDYGQAAMFYSWPSSSWSSLDPRYYLRDARELEFSIKYMREVFRTLAVVENASADLLAHSRGARATIKLLQGPGGGKLPLKINSLVLASADIDERDFVRDFVPSLQNFLPFATLYVSETDNALAAAELADGQKRVGQIARFYSDHVDTIRVHGETPTSLINHFFYATSPNVLSDLRSVVVYGKRALDRLESKGLVPHPDGYYNLELGEPPTLADRTILKVREFREHTRQAFEQLMEKLRHPRQTPK